MSKNKKYYFFIGPTLFNVNIETVSSRSVIFCPPIKRGDVEGLINSQYPSTIVIVDGVFHNSFPVGHAEIREAIRAGWTVWGGGSMGAIRAAEMKYIGMRGFGRVYKVFSLYKDFRDDEVALLHGIDPPYLPVSEPLIHIRMYLRDLEKRMLITKEVLNEIIYRLENIYFGNRTIRLVNSILFEINPKIKEEYLVFSSDGFQKYRIKSQDYLEFFDSEIWK